MTALLEVRDLCVSYGKVDAVRRVSLTVQPGEIISIIGPNGAGKTSLLGGLMGLVPATGQVRYLGRDLSDQDIEARVESGLCLVPERRELFGDLSVAENLRLGAYVRRADKVGSRQSLDAVYARFPRLAERRDQRASTLSGGERQMLALGRALMAKPRLLMLDEPSLGLAPLIVRDIFRIIAALKQTGVAILLVEQNARAALQTADSAHVIETGEVTLSGKASDLLNDRRVVATYLGGAP
jgi:branched-chain amino acid transport system ATP-binding protein